MKIKMTRKKRTDYFSQTYFFSIYNFATGVISFLRASDPDISQIFAYLIFCSIFLTKCLVYQYGFRSILQF